MWNDIPWEVSDGHTLKKFFDFVNWESKYKVPITIIIMFIIFIHYKVYSILYSFLRHIPKKCLRWNIDISHTPITLFLLFLVSTCKKFHSAGTFQKNEYFTWWNFESICLYIHCKFSLMTTPSNDHTFSCLLFIHTPCSHLFIYFS